MKSVYAARLSAGVPVRREATEVLWQRALQDALPEGFGGNWPREALRRDLESLISKAVTRRSLIICSLAHGILIKERPHKEYYYGRLYLLVSWYNQSLKVKSGDEAVLIVQNRTVLAQIPHDEMDELSIEGVMAILSNFG